MPYAIKRSGRQFEVVNADTGRVLGKHPTKKKANAQLAALAINIPGEFKKKKRGK